MGRLVGDLKERTLVFGTKVVRAVSCLPRDPRGWVIQKQLVRAGTSIGANVWEADAALTDAEFANKISIARKEASETQYWLELAQRTELMPRDTCEDLCGLASELARILGTIVRKTQTYMKESRKK